MEIVTFIFLKPFSENPFFTILIYGLFIGSLIYNWKINSQYKNRILQSDEVNQEDLDSFKHFSAIPGILMSIGIVGTFFLIYSSLSQFNIDDIQGISRIITNNVAPAFSVSALGVTASILYITFEGLIISRFKSHLKNKKQTSSEDNYLKLFQEQNNALKTIINGIQEQAEAFKDMKNFATSLQNASAGMEKLGEVSKNLEQILNPEKLGEVIADAALFVAKKKYSMSVRDNEGTRYPIDDPYIKVTGLEITQGGTAPFSKKFTPRTPAKNDPIIFALKVP
jgi:hypothetical protein